MRPVTKASMPSEADLVAMATRFTIIDDSLPITVERKSRLADPPSWAVMCGGLCLARDGEWEHEPLPSNRTEEFLARCRWNDLQAAIGAALAAAAAAN